MCRCRNEPANGDPTMRIIEKLASGLIAAAGVALLVEVTLIL